MTVAAGTDTTGPNDAAVTAAARLCAVMLLITPALLGGYVAGGALHDPDTCWLLALGRWIFEHGMLPQTDPFSYSCALLRPEQPVVLYQWLSEVIFFAVYKMAGLGGLLAASALALVLAFFALPLRVLCRAGLSVASATGLTLLMVLTASFHFLVRPEIFSYLLAAIWVERLAALDRLSSKRIDWKPVLVFFSLMVIWCNLHSGFVLGLVLLVSYVLASIAADVSSKSRGEKVNLTALVALGTSLVATCINPWGIGLWAYLPRLFFPAFNKYIVELKPVTVLDFGNPIFWPYLALLGTALLFAIRVAASATRKTGLVFGIFSLVLAGAGFVCRRLVPFAALYVLAGVTFIGSSARAAADNVGDASGSSESSRFFKKIDEHLQDVIAPGSIRWLVGSGLMASLGALLMSSMIIPPQLPQGSVVFQPPMKAIEFLSKSAPAGRALNDAQFGDVMIWHLNARPPVFIDTRFDMYGDKLVADYQTMTNNVGNWRGLLERYRISWLFVKSDCALAKTLEKEEPWRVIYKDNTAIILSR